MCQTVDQSASYGLARVILTIHKVVHLFIEKVPCWMWGITNLGRKGNRDEGICPTERVEAGSDSQRQAESLAVHRPACPTLKSRWLSHFKT